MLTKRKARSKRKSIFDPFKAPSKASKGAELTLTPPGGPGQSAGCVNRFLEGWSGGPGRGGFVPRGYRERDLHTSLRTACGNTREAFAYIWDV